MHGQAVTVARVAQPVRSRVAKFFLCLAVLVAIVLASVRLQTLAGFRVSLLDPKFVLLLVAVAVARKFCPARFYIPFGALTSAVLVGIGSPATLSAIAAIALLFLYPVHLLSLHLKQNEISSGKSKVLFGTSIVVLVLILAVFKVYQNFHPAFMGGPWAQSEVLALVGFSYFVFRTINFLHIQWILGFEETSPWGLLYFLLFPPTITSGPIQKYQDFRQQVLSPLPLTANNAGEAIYRITRGLFRKLVIAFLLDAAVAKLMASTSVNVYISIATITLLYLYFYFDFAGYSDIAIGFGLLMGIRVPENFKNPFRATSVTEFWRNWHVTLVDWFRDNVYIPLGGMRAGHLKAASLGFLIMVLCGFWHGLSLSFLAWGCWHGSLLFVEGITGSKPMPPSMRQGMKYWGRVLRTNALVAFGGIFFLPVAKSTALLHGLTKWF